LKAFLQTVDKEKAMNVFNRIVMVLLILALMALGVLLITMPLRAIDTLADVIASTRGLSVFTDNALYTYFVIGVGLLVVFLFILLILELRQPRQKTVRIRTEGDGRARIGVESVTQSLAYRIDELPGVRNARPRINSRGNDVDVAIDLDTSPSVNVPSVTGEVVKLAHEIIETQLGVKIHGPVQVNVSHEPFPRGTMAPGAGTAVGVETGSLPVVPPPTRRPPVVPPADTVTRDTYPAPVTPVEADRTTTTTRTNGK
jgi:hypothetical protein